MKKPVKSITHRACYTRMPPLMAITTDDVIHTIHWARLRRLRILSYLLYPRGVLSPRRSLFWRIDYLTPNVAVAGTLAESLAQRHTFKPIRRETCKLESKCFESWPRSLATGHSHTMWKSNAPVRSNNYAKLIDMTSAFKGGLLIGHDKKPNFYLHQICIYTSCGNC